MKSLGKSTDCHVAITILEIKRVKILKPQPTKLL
jgi:hypothetical protein